MALFSNPLLGPLDNVYLCVADIHLFINLSPCFKNPTSIKTKISQLSSSCRCPRLEKRRFRTFLLLYSDLICSALFYPCPPTHSCPSPCNLFAVSQVTALDGSFVYQGLLRPNTTFRWKEWAGREGRGWCITYSSKAEGGRLVVGGFASIDLQNCFLKHMQKCRHISQTPHSCSPTPV